MVKTDPKKVQNQICFAPLCENNGPPFYEKKISLHNPLKQKIYWTTYPKKEKSQVNVYDGHFKNQ